MATITSIFRGSMVEFAVSFTDAAGAPTDPITAVLYLNFPVRSGRDTVTMNLTQLAAGEPWTAAWGSGIADPGLVYGSVQASAPEGIATDFEFDLKANPANPREELP